MFWSVSAFIGLIVFFAWLLLQPMMVKLPTDDKNNSTKEVQEVEDVPEAPIEDNLEQKADYQAKEDDTIK